MKYSRKLILSGVLSFSMLGITACSTESVNQSTGANVEDTIESIGGDEMSISENPNLAKRVSEEEEYYIFSLNENVTRTHVYYKNRFGIELAGDIYMPKDADMSEEYPAIIIGAPFGGVKEQGPGVYANELAQRGFVVLTFDPSYHGYSGGEARMIGSTSHYVEDFSASADYLGTQSFINQEMIGVIGICGSGGFSLSATAMDTRIKAVAPIVMYDINGNMNSMEGEMRQQLLEQSSQQRWIDFQSGTSAYRTSYPEVASDEIPEGLDPVSDEFYSFYGTKRGHHPNALGNITDSSAPDFMNLLSLEHINEINPRPILFVVGENAHSRIYSETAYDNAAGPKEIYVVPEANHVDLYDQVNKIPFDKLESFFKESFK